MPTPSLKLLVTGEPGCGKTTLIRRVVEHLRPGVPMTGFTTQDVMGHGKRQGFRGVTLDGRTFTLATRDEEGEPRLGPYRVELGGLDTVGLASLRVEPGIRLVVVDELGKMGSMSEAFRNRIESLLDDEIPILGTVALHGVGFVKRIRHDRRVTLVRMRRRGRDGMVGEIVRRLRDAGIGPTGR